MNIVTQSKLLALSIAFCITTLLPSPAHAAKAIRALITNWGGEDAGRSVHRTGSFNTTGFTSLIKVI
jgi:hypothetical protein